MMRNGRGNGGRIPNREILSPKDSAAIEAMERWARAASSVLPEPLPGSPGYRRALVACRAALPAELRPSWAAMAKHVGCNERTLRRDSSTPEVIALARAVSCRVLGVALVGLLRSSLAGVAAQVAAGDTDALPVLVEAVERLGLAERVTDPRAAEEHPPPGGDVLGVFGTAEARAALDAALGRADGQRDAGA